MGKSIWQHWLTKAHRKEFSPQIKKFYRPLLQADPEYCSYGGFLPIESLSISYAILTYNPPLMPITTVIIYPQNYTLIWYVDL